MFDPQVRHRPDGYVCLTGLVNFSRALLCLVFAILACRLNAADRPNIIVVLVDDMGVMDTSVPMLTDESGKPKRYPLNDFYRTPNMQRLANLGVRFSNFHAMSVCSPTRISLMTGQNAARHRTTNWINPDVDNRGAKGPVDWNWQGLNQQSVTLAKLLQASGYSTFQLGKGHFGPRDSAGANPKNLGFDVSIGGASIGQPGSYYSEKKYGASAGSAQHAVPDLEGYFESGLFLTEALTREANRLISQSVEEQRPFFLYMAHYAVHAPFESDPRFAENYRGSGKPKNAQAYATLIEGMDKSLGDILDHLAVLGIGDRTIVFFLGDNGSDAPLGEAHAVGSSAPLRGKKGSHYEGGTRAPLIAAWANPDSESKFQKRLPIAKNSVQVQLAAVPDIFPTLLQLAEIPLPTNHPVDGNSLAELFSGKPDSSRPNQFLMHYPHGPHRSEYFTVWRNGDWKLVYHYFPKDGQAHQQLFNLADDPFESNDLAASEAERVAELQSGLIEQLKSHDALLPQEFSYQSLSPPPQELDAISK